MKVAEGAWLALLGPLELRCGETPIPVPSRQQRTLLAILGSHAGRPVSAERIADLLWDGKPPTEHANAVVRTHVMRLRKTLGARLSRRLVTRRPGYLLELGDDELDLLAFEAHYERAAAAVRARSWARAETHLTAGLALWRGEPLEDVSSQSLRDGVVPRLERRRLQLLEWHHQAQLELGNYTEAITGLREAVEKHPLREEFHRQLMVALHRAGRRSEALAAYRDARRRLIEELGVEPGPELQRLYQDILADDAREPGEPRQVPRAPRHFVGRREALRELDRLPPIAVISGMGGIGKSALAAYWAHRAADRFPDGQLFVNLKGFDPVAAPVDPAKVVRGFLDALGVSEDRMPSDFEDQCALYRRLLADRKMLVVLDNARSADQVRPLLPGNPGCMVLVTSRNRLHGLLVGEGALAVQLQPFTEEETHALLHGVLGESRLSREPEATSRLTKVCGGIPLTVSVAATIIATEPRLSIAVWLDELTGGMSDLDRFETGDPATSIRSVISASYRHLREPAARMFRALGLNWSATAGVAAAAALAGIGEADARPILIELAQNNLVAVDELGRFTMHDVIKAYAAERAAAEESPADRRAARLRLLDYYVTWARRAAARLDPGRVFDVPRAGPDPGPGFPSPTRAAEWFETHYDALLPALTRSEFRNGHGWRLLEGMSGFMERRGRWHDWAEAARRVLNIAIEDDDLRGQAVAELELGCALTKIDPGERAFVHLERALALFGTLGDEHGRARAHLGLAGYHGGRGQADECRRHAGRAASLYRRTGNHDGLAQALNAWGWHCIGFGDTREAIETCSEALRLYQRSGNRTGEADVWDSLGYAYQNSGAIDQAIECYERATALDSALDRLGNQVHQADTQIRFGEVLMARGNAAAAREAWRHAFRILHDIGHPRAQTVRAAYLGGDPVPGP